MLDVGCEDVCIYGAWGVMLDGGWTTEDVGW